MLLELGVNSVAEIQINVQFSSRVEFLPSFESSLLSSALCQAMVKLLGLGRMMVNLSVSGCLHPTIVHSVARDSLVYTGQQHSCVLCTELPYRCR